MRFNPFRLFVCIVAVFAMAACASLPPAPSPAQQGINAQALADQLATARGAIADLKTAVAATTQPVIVTPATATSPAVTVQLPPEVAKAAGKADAALTKVDIAAAVAQGIAAAATQPGSNPGPIVVAASPLAGQYAPLVALAGSLLGLGYSMYQTNRAKAATASVTSAVNDAITAGKITVQPGAAAEVNRAVLDHPSTDAIVNVMSAAGGGPYIAR